MPTPTNPDQFTFLTMNSASPFGNQFAGDEGGKTAHYLMRWVTRGGDHSDWSEILSTGIVGF